MTTSFIELPEAEQRLVAERLLKIQESGWRPFWCPVSDCDGMPHKWLVDDGDGPTPLYVAPSATEGPNGEPLGEYEEGLGRPVLDPKWAHNHARVDQRLPAWKNPWVLLLLSGRGTGKTLTGTEFVTLSARKGLDGAILGRRGTELINTHVATLIERAHPEFVPEYLASKDLILWPNGAKTFLFSAEKPENIRSVNLSYAWVDEAAFMDEIETAWMNLKLATRIDTPGNPIHILVTSTPTSTPWVMKMEDDPDVEVRRVSTFANRANLSKDYIDTLIKEYEGTRMGRQEIYGEVLRDVEGALWNDDLFQHLRLDAMGFHDAIEGMDDTVVSVDPAGSKGPRSDATGIIASGAQHFDDDGSPLPVSRFFVLGDATLKGTPTEWAAQTFKMARLVKARRIVAEKNYGGDMVKQVLADYAKLNPIIACDHNGEAFKIEVVHAEKSKEVRAEGTVAKYEQGRVTHVTSPTAFGDLSELEKEQVGWVPKSRGGRLPSPNRIDALVWGVRSLEATQRYGTQMASQSETLGKLKRG
jgi:phage terminase large subunit-like protein